MWLISPEVVNPRSDVPFRCFVTRSLAGKLFRAVGILSSTSPFSLVAGLAQHSVGRRTKEFPKWLTSKEKKALR
jgi:hypothetical protein